MVIKKQLYQVVGMLMGLSLLTGCGQDAKNADKQETQKSGTESALEKVDNSKWLYNSDDNVYYQLGITYCGNPAEEEYENLAVFVPGEYMNASDNGDGTFQCDVQEDAEVGNYTAKTAPIVLPVDTPGYSAQSALDEYQSFTEYTKEGMIYVHAGCRGREAGAPSGVTDLKAAIRYIRYNDGNIAGDMDKIFSFGMSGGGAQSALLGVTGDSGQYEDYLEAIGAVSGVSDAVYGSMAWCPITSLDSANEAYEWNMGATRSELSDEEQKISEKLTEAYAEYINSIGFTDAEGNTLTLEQSDDGRYQSGSYYDYVKAAIEDSLNQFLADTTFPYDADSANQGHQAGMDSNGGRGAAMGGRRQAQDGEMTGKGGKEGSAEDAGNDSEKQEDYTQRDNISRTDSSGGVTLSGTYETVEDYIAALNADGTWVTYDAETAKASITSIQGFAQAMKNASKGMAAFDQLDASQGENILFGFGDGDGAHFDTILSNILTELKSEYADAYISDLEQKDALGHTAEERLNMYSPLYYLLKSAEGYQSSTVAKHFRIRTGICQSDTAVTTELNLAQALENEGCQVDFAMVWGQEHTKAETSGDSTENFINWVHDCMTS